MARTWHSLSPRDPALKLHAVLHDAVDGWLLSKNHTCASHLIVSMGLERNLRGARADVLSMNISTRVGEAIAAIILEEAEALTSDWYE
jgi:hypothetical protein